MIGIVGFGRFGALAARYLSRDFPVWVYDKGQKGKRIEAAGARGASLEAVCQQRLLLLCVPISAMQQQLRTVAPLLGAKTIVADVCSVKTLPVQWMKSLLPSTAQLLPTHPMFGPDSAAETLAGGKIVLCRERIEARRFDRIRVWLEAQGLEVIETTPADHDRQIAVSLSLTHFIGRSLSAFGAKKQVIDTEGYKRLMHILGVVENDSWQLFVDMHCYNPYAREQRLAFINAMQAINLDLEACEFEHRHDKD